MEVGAGSRVIEFAKKAAELAAAASGRKTAAFGKEVECRNSRGALVADDLNYSGHGVRTVKRAFGAVHDFNLVDVVEGQVREIHVAARKIDRSPINKHLGEGGVAAIDKDGGQATDRTGACQAYARLRGQKIRKRDGLALLDFLRADDIDGGGNASKLGRLRVSGDDHVGRERGKVEAETEGIGFSGSEVDDHFARGKRGARESHAVAAGGQVQGILAARGGFGQPSLGIRRTLHARLHLNVSDAATVRIGEGAGKMREPGIILCFKVDAEAENCKGEKSRTNRGSFHVVLHSLTRGSLKVVLSVERPHRLRTSPVSWLGGVDG